MKKIELPEEYIEYMDRKIKEATDEIGTPILKEFKEREGDLYEILGRLYFKACLLKTELEKQKEEK